MKKIFIVLAAGLLAFSFAGCGGGQATTEEAVATLANPWVDVKTLEEAEELAGFEVELPAEVAEASGLVYRYCEALKEIEVHYSGGYVRKAKDSGDISGDYNEYKEVLEVTENGITATLKGDSDNSFKLAVWMIGDYSYCAGVDEGVPAAEMKRLIAGLK